MKFDPDKYRTDFVPRNPDMKLRLGIRLDFKPLRMEMFQQKVLRLDSVLQAVFHGLSPPYNMLLFSPPIAANVQLEI